MTIRLYLDTSVYNRPFDDQSQPRIWLEALAFSLILEYIEKGDVDLICSTVVQFETSRNPHELRQRWINSLMSIAVDNVKVDERIRLRAKQLESAGIKPLDALHVSAAEIGQADYLVTCDDRLIKRYQDLSATVLTVGTPTEFVRQFAPYEEE